MKLPTSLSCYIITVCSECSEVLEDPRPKSLTSRDVWGCTIKYKDGCPHCHTTIDMQEAQEQQHIVEITVPTSITANDAQRVIDEYKRLKDKYPDLTQTLLCDDPRVKIKNYDKALVDLRKHFSELSRAYDNLQNEVNRDNAAFIRGMETLRNENQRLNTALTKARQEYQWLEQAKVSSSIIINDPEKLYKRLQDIAQRLSLHFHTDATYSNTLESIVGAVEEIIHGLSSANRSTRKTGEDVIMPLNSKTYHGEAQCSLSPALPMSKFQQALSGARGDDQRRIAETGLEFIHTILCKNADYGSSVWKEPTLCPGMSVDSAIRVRASDKIERIIQLLQREAEVKTETIVDTFRDLGAYCLLWLARPQPANSYDGPTPLKAR